MSEMTAVVCCRPVDWSEIGIDPEVVRRATAKVHAGQPNLHPEHDPLTGIYPGSVVRPCAACGVRCWVGPRSMTTIETGSALVGCYRCVLTSQGPEALDAMQTLGNTDVARRPGGAT